MKFTVKFFITLIAGLYLAGCGVQSIPQQKNAVDASTELSPDKRVVTLRSSVLADGRVSVEVEDRADPRGQALEEPDVGDRRR